MIDWKKKMLQLNPLMPTATLENQRFPNVSREHRSGTLVENGLNFFLFLLWKRVHDRPYTILLVFSHMHEKYQKLESLKNVRQISNPILGFSKITVICCNSNWNIVLSARSIPPEAAIERCSFTHFLYKN